MRLVYFVITTVLVVAALFVAWAVALGITGDSFMECDKSDCGALGEFTANWLLALPLVALVIGIATAWRLDRLRRRKLNG